MRWPGFSVSQLARALRTAYVSGLLTEETFTHRIDDLLESFRVNPGEVVGDLNLRPQHRMRDRLRSLCGSAWRWSTCAEDELEQFPFWRSTGPAPSTIYSSTEFHLQSRSARSQRLAPPRKALVARGQLDHPAPRLDGRHLHQWPAHGAKRASPRRRPRAGDRAAM